jgi:indolepyruvate ferredoxin oxidoreductase, alpha subunit
MKALLTGNEAIARGAHEFGCRVATAYPGTPSTEILENVVKYPEIYCEWSTNEKVALEVAMGGSFAGVRSLAAMKHVGLNVAADPFFSLGYIGATGGIIVITADDPSLHSSQNEQDNRHYGIAAKMPILEPSDSQDCRDFIGLGYEISEKFDTPVLFRTTTRISHTQSVVTLGEPMEAPIKGYIADFTKRNLLPMNARIRHKLVEERLLKLAEYGNTLPANKMEIKDKKVGFIASSVAFCYAREAFPDWSYLKLALTNPLPVGLIRQFASSVKELYVIEELDPILEQQIKALGIACHGKDRLPLLYEFNPDVVKFGVEQKEKPAALNIPFAIPPRPPVLCPGCPHRGVYYVLGRYKKAIYTGDIGCYTLGALPPLSAMDTCVDMGASISAAIGIDKGRNFAAGDDRPIFATIGDSTFIHSGITGLIDAVYNGANINVIILDNGITAMTGHQHHPATGYTLMGKPSPQVDLVELVKACGVEHVQVVDPLDLGATRAALDEAVAHIGTSVVIAESPCVLIDKTVWHKPLVVDMEKCTKCKVCLRISCPAINMDDEGAHIDVTLCTGCGACWQVCKFDAISTPEGKEVVSNG